jgi:hypothetical protein
MCTAFVALLGIGLGFAQPWPFVRAHLALFSGGAPAYGPDFALTRGEAEPWEAAGLEGGLVRTVAASLQRDRALAAHLGGRRMTPSAAVPERAFVVSRFPLPDGREVQVYTSLLPEQDEVVDQAVLTSEGGAW